jgi:hypothetical protein
MSVDLWIVFIVFQIECNSLETGPFFHSQVENGSSAPNIVLCSKYKMIDKI